MTRMKRRSISLPEQLEAELVRLRKTEKFCRASYSEIIRYLLDVGIKKNMEQKNQAG